MLIFVFIMFAVMFAIAGTFISIEAKRRSETSALRPLSTSITRFAPAEIEHRLVRGSAIQQLKVPGGAGAGVEGDGEGAFVSLAQRRA